MVVLRTGWLAARRFYICMYISNNNLDYTYKCKTGARQAIQCKSQPILYNMFIVGYGKKLMKNIK